jgi:hypothetical protein
VKFVLEPDPIRRPRSRDVVSARCAGAGPAPDERPARAQLKHPWLRNTALDMPDDMLSSTLAGMRWLTASLRTQQAEAIRKAMIERRAQRCRRSRRVLCVCTIADRDGGSPSASGTGATPRLGPAAAVGDLQRQQWWMRRMERGASLTGGNLEQVLRRPRLTRSSSHDQLYSMATAGPVAVPTTRSRGRGNGEPGTLARSQTDSDLSPPPLTLTQSGATLRNVVAEITPPRTPLAASTGLRPPRWSLSRNSGMSAALIPSRQEVASALGNGAAQKPAAAPAPE